MYQATPFIGSGEIYINGRDVGNASDFTIQAPKIDTKELKSMRRESYGTVVKSVPISFSQSLKFTLTDINKDNLILAMYGEGSVISQTSDSANDEVVAVTKGRWSYLAHRKVKSSPAVVVTNSDGTITYVNGTDYEIDYDAGRILALESGAIANGNVKVDYSYDAYTGYKVDANKQQVIEAEIRFIGRDIAMARNVEVVVYKASTQPSSEVDLLSTDFIKLGFTGDILSTASGTWTMTVI